MFDSDYQPPSGMAPTMVMLSHKSRARTARRITLAGLERWGVQPQVFESTTDEPSDAEVKRMAWWAITSGQRNPDGVVFFEDDVVVVNGVALQEFLNGPRPEYDMVTLCLLRRSLLAGEWDTKAGEPRLLPLNMPAFAADRGFHGSMGIWLSHDTVTLMARSREQFMTSEGGCITEPKHRSEFARGGPCGFDFWLKDYVGSAAVFAPEPLAHGVYPSTIRRT